MIDIDYRVNFECDLELLNKICKKFSTREVELIITNNDEIKNINKEHRNIDKATDVLSFPLEDFEMGEVFPLGSIIISIDKVEEKAKEYCHSEKDEFTLLFIHGLLHLLGYDHEIDDGQMREKEEELIKEFNLPNSLIVRNLTTYPQT